MSEKPHSIKNNFCIGGNACLLFVSMFWDMILKYVFCVCCKLNAANFFDESVDQDFAYLLSSLQVYTIQVLII